MVTMGTNAPLLVSVAKNVLIFEILNEQKCSKYLWVRVRLLFDPPVLRRIYTFPK
jgi:hypothetical protein